MLKLERWSGRQPCWVGWLSLWEAKGWAWWRGPPGGSGEEEGRKRGQAWAVAVVCAAGASAHAEAELDVTRNWLQESEGQRREGSGAVESLSSQDFRTHRQRLCAGCVLQGEAPAAAHHLCSCGRASLGGIQGTHAHLELREMRGMLSGGAEAVLFDTLIYLTCLVRIVFSVPRILFDM